ncbi:MAG: hypothetical protein AB8G17_06845 [Gammaproteobacteria bacterium]
MTSKWKQGRGKLGFLKPLLGNWRTDVPDTPMGPVVCQRHYTSILDGKFIRLSANWDINNGAKHYEEIAHYGVNRDKVPSFWSFTSEGGTSRGTLTDVTDLHPNAYGFEAQMPAGLARLAFWPHEDGMIWVADAKTKKGWSRMIEHVCHRVAAEN